MDVPGTLAEQLAKGRIPYGLAQCRIFERPGDFMETSPFGVRIHPVTGERITHNGVDGAVWTGTALGESTIVAPLPGIVLEAVDGIPGFSREYPRGNYVILDHGNGLQTRYFHLECGSVRVRPADIVQVGTRLGFMGKTGLATGEHIHFELWLNGIPVNPIPFLKTPPNDRNPIV